MEPGVHLTHLMMVLMTRSLMDSQMASVSKCSSVFMYSQSARSPLHRGKGREEMGQVSRGKGREEGREGRLAEYHAQCHACRDANSSPFHQITKSPGMYIRTYVRTYM